MGALAARWDKFVDYLGRFLMHATNSAAAGRASHETVDAKAFDGPIYPTRRSGKGPPPTKKADEDEDDVTKEAVTVRQRKPWVGGRDTNPVD